MQVQSGWHTNSPIHPKNELDIAGVRSLGRSEPRNLRGHVIMLLHDLEALDSSVLTFAGGSCAQTISGTRGRERPIPVRTVLLVQEWTVPASPNHLDLDPAQSRHWGHYSDSARYKVSMTVDVAWSAKPYHRRHLSA